MKFDTKTLDYLEAYIEALIQRMILVKVIGKEHPLVYEMDRIIDAIRNNLENKQV